MKRDMRKILEDRAKKQVSKADPSGILGELRCFPEVKKMIEDGAMTRDVVAYIHGKGEATHISRNALSYALARYRRHVDGDSIGTDPGVVSEKEKLDQEDPASVVYALREQFFAMHKRLQMQSETEMSLGLLFPTTSREFATSAQLGEKLMKLYEKFDMLDPSNLSGSRTDMGFHGPINVSEVLNKPKSRQKILGILDLIAQNPQMYEGVTNLEEGKKRRERPKKKQKLHAVPSDHEDTA
jgi:hypothetical protein